MDKDYLKVEGYPELVRDMETGALLNIDYDKVRLAQKRKMHLESTRNKEQHNDNRISALENDISEIKYMLSELLKSYK